MIVIDAQDQLLGRFVTAAAKQALLGNDVAIVNCEKAIISGRKADVIAKYKQRRIRGEPFNGPFFPRMPDRLVKRTVKGMLPTDKARGRTALDRVKCYVGAPESVKGEAFKVNADVKKLPTTKYLTVATICKELGWKG